MMRTSKRPLAAVAVAALTFAAATSRAAVVYTFATAPTTLAKPAGTVGVDVFVRETLTGNSTTLIAGGLDGAAFNVVRTSGASVKLSSLSYNPSFGSDVNTKSVTDSLGRLNETTANGAAAVLPSGGQVYVGTAFFANNPAAGGSTSFAIQLYDNFGGNVVTRSGLSLDTNPGNGSYTPLSNAAPFVVAVPEPTTLIAVPAAAIVSMVRRRRA